MQHVLAMAGIGASAAVALWAHRGLCAEELRVFHHVPHVMLGAVDAEAAAVQVCLTQGIGGLSRSALFGLTDGSRLGNDGGPNFLFGPLDEILVEGHAIMVEGLEVLAVDVEGLDFLDVVDLDRVDVVFEEVDPIEVEDVSHRIVIGLAVRIVVDGFNDDLLFLWGSTRCGLHILVIGECVRREGTGGLRR